jgi:hypothetical protein
MYRTPSIYSALFIIKSLGVAIKSPVAVLFDNKAPLETFLTVI